mgnify:CR=1 FL=1
MAFFESFTSSIKQKWLDYYQVNRLWLELQMEGRSVRTPDGGRRPCSALILGVVNSLEPKLANLMVPFFKLNGDEDAIIEVLIEEGPLIDELIGPVPDDDEEEPFSISVFGIEGLFIIMTSTDEMHGGFDTAQDAFEFIDREYERELASPDDLQ